MAHEPILASYHIAGIRPILDANGNPIPCAIYVDDNYSPARVIVELPDRALRDLGKVDIAEIPRHSATDWSYHENSSNALTDQEVKAAPAAGVSIYVTDVVFSPVAACTVLFEEGATTVLGPWQVPAGTGIAIHFYTPKKITAATALTATTSAATAHSLEVLGYTA